MEKNTFLYIYIIIEKSPGPLVLARADQSLCPSNEVGWRFFLEFSRRTTGNDLHEPERFCVTGIIILIYIISGEFRRGKNVIRFGERSRL